MLNKFYFMLTLLLFSKITLSNYPECEIRLIEKHSKPNNSNQIFNLEYIDDLGTELYPLSSTIGPRGMIGPKIQARDTKAIPDPDKYLAEKFGGFYWDQRIYIVESLEQIPVHDGKVYDLLTKGFYVVGDQARLRDILIKNESRIAPFRKNIEISKTEKEKIDAKKQFDKIQKAIGNETKELVQSLIKENGLWTVDLSGKKHQISELFLNWITEDINMFNAGKVKNDTPEVAMALKELNKEFSILNREKDEELAQSIRELQTNLNASISKNYEIIIDELKKSIKENPTQKKLLLETYQKRDKEIAKAIEESELKTTTLINSKYEQQLEEIKQKIKEQVEKRVFPLGVAFRQPGYVIPKIKGLINHSDLSDSQTIEKLRSLFKTYIKKGWKITFNKADPEFLVERAAKQKHGEGAVESRFASSKKNRDMMIEALKSGNAMSVEFWDPNGVLVASTFGSLHGAAYEPETVSYDADPALVRDYLERKEKGLLKEGEVEPAANIDFAKFLIIAASDRFYEAGVKYLNAGMVTPFTRALKGRYHDGQEAAAILNEQKFSRYLDIKLPYYPETTPLITEIEIRDLQGNPGHRGNEGPINQPSGMFEPTVGQMQGLYKAYSFIWKVRYFYKDNFEEMISHKKLEEDIGSGFYFKGNPLNTKALGNFLEKVMKLELPYNLESVEDLQGFYNQFLAEKLYSKPLMKLNELQRNEILETTQNEINSNFNDINSFTRDVIGFNAPTTLKSIADLKEFLAEALSYKRKKLTFSELSEGEKAEIEKVVSSKVQKFLENATKELTKDDGIFYVESTPYKELVEKVANYEEMADLDKKFEESISQRKFEMSFSELKIRLELAQESLKYWQQKLDRKILKDSPYSSVQKVKDGIRKIYQKPILSIVNHYKEKVQQIQSSISYIHIQAKKKAYEYYEKTLQKELSEKGAVYFGDLVVYKYGESFTNRVDFRNFYVEYPVSLGKNHKDENGNPRPLGETLFHYSFVKPQQRGLVFVSDQINSGLINEMRKLTKKLSRAGWRIEYNFDIDKIIELAKKTKRKGQSDLLNRYLNPDEVRFFKEMYQDGHAFTISIVDPNNEPKGATLGMKTRNKINGDSVAYVDTEIVTELKTEDDFIKVVKVNKSYLTVPFIPGELSHLKDKVDELIIIGQTRYGKKFKVDLTKEGGNRRIFEQDGKLYLGERIDGIQLAKLTSVFSSIVPYSQDARFNVIDTEMVSSFSHSIKAKYYPIEEAVAAFDSLPTDRDIDFTHLTTDGGITYKEMNLEDFDSYIRVIKDRDSKE